MRFGGIVVIVALLLGGCSTDPEPNEPTKSTSSPTPTSTATVPAMPEQAKEGSPEGAAAFVTHWVNVFNYAAATGDVDELSRLSSPECEGCQRYIKLFRDTYKAGGYFKGGEWSLGKLDLTGDAVEVVVKSDLEVASGARSSGPDNEIREGADSMRVGFSLPSTAPWRLEQLFLEQEES